MIEASLLPRQCLGKEEEEIHKRCSVAAAGKEIRLLHLKVYANKQTCHIGNGVQGGDEAHACGSVLLVQNIHAGGIQHRGNNLGIHEGLHCHGEPEADVEEQKQIGKEQREVRQRVDDDQGTLPAIRVTQNSNQWQSEKLANRHEHTERGDEAISVHQGHLAVLRAYAQLAMNLARRQIRVALGKEVQSHKLAQWHQQSIAYGCDQRPWNNPAQRIQQLNAVLSALLL
mmetsp:Transcript_94005/g.223746  ORF Transcript_94005/g.223746 Transcript_94005/m.223746 type:complete len:228 (+) Transcript_94005:832-1515(+)